jgi:hypothetical protein
VTLAFASTVFLSAFLLFQSQLIIAKYLLPWFGGTPAVWTTCMVFFQVLLLAGYGYSHFVSRRLGARNQMAMHVGLLASSLTLLLALARYWPAPILPGAPWKPVASQTPVLDLLLLLSVTVGFPFFLLSTTGPLLQAWFLRASPGTSPYRLYALSNLGSLLGLATYPFLIEPALALNTQAWAWSRGYAVFALGSGACAWWAGKSALLEQPQPGAEGLGQDPPGALRHTLWIALAACASTLLLATTNRLCQDVAVIPFLWVLPLSLYLASLVICFDHDRWYSSHFFQSALAGVLPLACVLLLRGPVTGIVTQIVLYSVVLFVCCMFCHGELARAKPPASHLTSFYLSVALGGALGGVFVAGLAPLIFPAYWEYQAGLFGCLVLAAVVAVRDRTSWYRGEKVWVPVLLFVGGLVVPIAAGRTLRDAREAWYAIVVVSVFLGILLLARTAHRSATRILRSGLAGCASLLVTLILGTMLADLYSALEVSRNFHGVLAVLDVEPADPRRHARILKHGRVVHGVQYVDAAARQQPSSYFVRDSGLGLALLNHPRRNARGDQRPLRIGVLGLGIGTVAAYGRPGDRFRFYENNPEVLRLARDTRYFHYLEDTPAEVEVVLGDGRLSLEEELHHQSQQFDLLALDAFSSDAVPVHLLTREAFAVYLGHLAPDGILAVNISNRSLDLRPVILKLAEHYRLAVAFIPKDNPEPFSLPSHWMLLARSPEVLGAPAIQTARHEVGRIPQIRVWTDDYTNLFQVLK